MQGSVTLAALSTRKILQRVNDFCCGQWQWKLTCERPCPQESHDDRATHQTAPAPHLLKTKQKKHAPCTAVGSASSVACSETVACPLVTRDKTVKQSDLRYRHRGCVFRCLLVSCIVKTWPWTQDGWAYIYICEMGDRFIYMSFCLSIFPPRRIYSV